MKILFYKSLEEAKESFQKKGKKSLVIKRPLKAGEKIKAHPHHSRQWIILGHKGVCRFWIGTVPYAFKCNPEVVMAVPVPKNTAHTFEAITQMSYTVLCEE